MIQICMEKKKIEKEKRKQLTHNVAPKLFVSVLIVLCCTENETENCEKTK